MRRFLVLLFIAVGAGAIVAVGAGAREGSPGSTTVPLIAGLTTSQAECVLHNKGLRWRYAGEGRVFSRPMLAGAPRRAGRDRRCSNGATTRTHDFRVVEQRPAAGQEVDPGTVVDFKNECHVEPVPGCVSYVPPPCNVGGSPRFLLQVLGRPQRGRTTVLGCADLRGRHIEVVARRMSRRFSCIDAHFPARGPGVGVACVSSSNARTNTISVSSLLGRRVRLAQQVGGGFVSGTAAGDVARVESVYQLNGRERRREAALVSVRDPRLLSRIRAGRPWGLFVAALPPRGAQNLRFRALGANGAVLGEDHALARRRL